MTVWNVTRSILICLKATSRKVGGEKEREIAWYILLQPTNFFPENEFEIVLMLWFQIDFNNIVDPDILLTNQVGLWRFEMSRDLL